MPLGRIQLSSNWVIEFWWVTLWKRRNWQTFSKHHTPESVYPNLQKNTIKMHTWWEVFGCKTWLMSEITEICIVFRYKISSMAINFILNMFQTFANWNVSWCSDILMIRIWFFTITFVFRKFHCTMEIDCNIILRAEYFSNEKFVQLRSYCKKTVMYTKKLEFYTF